MSLQFKKKEDVGFTLKTTILKENKYNIYEYSQDNCNKYFKFRENIKNIGYIINGNFIVVNLEGKDFDNNYKQYFHFIDENSIKLLSNDMKNLNTFEKKNRIGLNEQLQIIPEFKYIKLDSYCFTKVDLTEANKKIDILNTKLNCYNYTLKLDYVFNMAENTEVDAYMIDDGSTLLLCIYSNSKCVSSLVIRYIENDIYIESKTNEAFKGKKLNKLLRSVIIFLSKTLFPNANALVSVAHNPISAFIMIKYFNAVPIENTENKTFNNINEIENYINDNDVLKTEVLLNDENIQHAESVFDKMVKSEIQCDKIGKKYYKTRCKRKTKNKKQSKHKSRKNRRNSVFVVN